MSDQDAAEQIANSLGDRPGESRTWYEVRTLLQRFEIPRFTADAQDRITSALAGAGVAIEPDLHTRERRDTVFLFLTADGEASTPALLPAAEAVTVRAASAAGRINVVPLVDAAKHTSGVLWFDVHEPHGLDVSDAPAAVSSLCPGATAEMWADLISPDPRPKAVQYSRGSVRSLSTFRVRALESDDGAEDSTSMAGVLVFDPVEILVGPGWLITCWHESQKFRGAKRIRQLPRAPYEDAYAEIERRWTDGFSTSGDLAVLLLDELAATYKPACRQLRVWEEEWELDYIRTDHADGETLLETYGSLAMLRDWLSPLNIPGVRDDINRAWFPGLSARGRERALRVDDRVDQSLSELTKVNTLIRDAYRLLEVRRVSHAQKRDERFQRTIAIGGAAILIPTLVAGVMGMNVWVPGEYGPTSAKWAFLVLIIVMVISALLAWYALKRMHDREI